MKKDVMEDDLEAKLSFMKNWTNDLIEQVYINKHNLEVLWDKVMKDER